MEAVTDVGEESEVYGELAEFHDLFMPPAWERMRRVVRESFGALGADDLVVELGAGSGIGTRVIAAESAARIHAVEPSLTMRSMLTARVADDEDLSRRVTITAGGVPHVLQDLDRPVSGVVCAHMLGHLDVAARRALAEWLAVRLAPDGVAVVTTQERHDADVAETDAGERRRRLGDQEYRAEYLAESDGRFATRYQVWRDHRLVRDHIFSGSWEIVSAADLAADLHRHGLDLTPSIAGVATVRRR